MRSTMIPARRQAWRIDIRDAGLAPTGIATTAWGPWSFGPCICGSPGSSRPATSCSSSASEPGNTPLRESVLLHIFSRRAVSCLATTHSSGSEASRSVTRISPSDPRVKWSWRCSGRSSKRRPSSRTAVWINCCGRRSARRRARSPTSSPPVASKPKTVGTVAHWGVEDTSSEVVGVLIPTSVWLPRSIPTCKVIMAGAAYGTGDRCQSPNREIANLTGPAPSSFRIFCGLPLKRCNFRMSGHRVSCRGTCET